VPFKAGLCLRRSGVELGPFRAGLVNGVRGAGCWGKRAGVPGKKGLLGHRVGIEILTEGCAVDGHAPGGMLRFLRGEKEKNALGKERRGPPTRRRPRRGERIPKESSNFPGARVQVAKGFPTGENASHCTGWRRSGSGGFTKREKGPAGEKVLEIPKNFRKETQGPVIVVSGGKLARKRLCRGYCRGGGVGGFLGG